MASNSIDLGAVQGATKQDLGAMQGTGASQVNESITLGVSAAVALSPAALAQASISVGVSAAASPSGPVSEIDQVTLGASVDVAALQITVKDGFAEIDVALGLDFLDKRDARPNPVVLGASLGLIVADTIHFGATRRGKSAVVVSPKSSGKVTVR